MRILSPHEKFAVLIVEADPKVRRQLEEAATKSERFWSVEAMSDGRFALEHLWACLENPAKIAPDIVIANTQLPGLTGAQLTRELRRYEELRQTFVAILSGSGGAIEQDAAENAGCDFFLRRPKSPEDTVDALVAIACRCSMKAAAPERLLS
jgi:CheY-like chemotaxis protein